MARDHVLFVAPRQLGPVFITLAASSWVLKDSIYLGNSLSH